ncbi:MAG: SurA N-terminal domain-containing protein [Wolbachia endosymbiont of Tyrophagus putrescentiae]|nr:SurA N-terminal domain-containing protein [Wolbachia endosymbiont of Tyrophagus putrescentiae]
MYRVLILLFVVFSFKVFAANIKIVADVNNTPISSLDIQKRIKLTTALFGAPSKDLESQVLKQLVDEVIIVNESERLNIKLDNKELSKAVTSFFTQGLGVKENDIDQYVKKHGIGLTSLTQQIKCELLWNKIIGIRVVPFINGISDREVDDKKAQIEKSDYLITFIEEGNHTPKKTTVSLNQLQGDLKRVLEKLNIGEVANFGKGTIKVLDKVQVSYELLNSTLSLKHATVKDLEKKQRLDFSTLSNVKELTVKMRDLSPGLQILLSKTNINEIVEFRESDVVNLIMLCDVKSNPVDTEAIKQQIYEQKIIAQSNLLFDEMRKNAVINYLKAN